MNDDVQAFGSRLGARVLARDWAGVHELLAPWLRSQHTPADVGAFFEDEYRATLRDNGIDEMHYPEATEPRLGGNAFTNATALREPIAHAGGRVRPVADEVTDENMRYWLNLQLLCSEEQEDELDFDVFAEIWLAVVDTAEGLRVGYWSTSAY